MSGMLALAAGADGGLVELVRSLPAMSQSLQVAWLVTQP